jgi:hypothetical protein
MKKLYTKNSLYFLFAVTLLPSCFSMRFQEKHVDMHYAGFIDSNKVTPPNISYNIQKISLDTFQNSLTNIKKKNRTIPALLYWNFHKEMTQKINNSLIIEKHVSLLNNKLKKVSPNYRIEVDIDQVESRYGIYKDTKIIYVLLFAFYTIEEFFQTDI